MKALLAIFILVAATLAVAADNSSSLKGKVLEVKDVDSYTYLRVKTKDGEIWAAVTKAQVKEGGDVAIENVTVMKNFESKSLKRSFDTIYFGTLSGGAAQATSPHGAAVQATPGTDVRISKAVGNSSRTVAEIVTRAVELKDKSVLVRGQVVKYTPNIMGKNWIHLQDGSGSASNMSNDILLTTTNQAKVGDVVTIKGTVRTNKDFGSGYVYNVLIEDAAIQP